MKYATPQLTLDQAYQAAFLWLDHVDGAPTSITEPTDGVIELRTDSITARVRWDRSPINQTAVLAMLRQSVPTSKRILFSVTGLTAGAVSLADTQGVALFSFDSLGQTIANNAHALAIAPNEPSPLPFALPPEEPEEDLPVVTAPPEHMEYDLSEWLDCPRCGLTHHHRSNFCMSCGADLHVAAQASTDTTSTAGDPDDESTERPGPTPAPPQDSGGPRLRCRTCGSDDIELIHPGYAH